MAQITQQVQLFRYSGPELPLAGASFLGNVSRICQQNTGGIALVSYRPGSIYPPFASLKDGGVYLVYSTTVPYEIPTTDTPRTTVPYQMAGSVFSL